MKKKIDPRLIRIHYNDSVKDKPEIVIFDLDGTLSMMNGRSPYDGAAAITDVPNESVIQVLKLYNKAGIGIFIFSGRNSDKGGREATKLWLDNNNVPYDILAMRKAGDMRKDTIVKGEMFDEHVRGSYRVSAVYDDRNMMIDFWRNSLGLDCFQVYYGDF